MNYYYDIKLNFLDNNYLFYDWEDNDNIEYIKKIPLYQVTSKKFKEIYKYNGKVNKEFLEEIENKTILKNGKLKYATLIADKNNVIALEFAQDGHIITRSSLMLKDELALLDLLYNIPLKDLYFQKDTKLNNNLDLRKCLEIKEFITLEINKLDEEKDLLKLKYLYLEWFKKECIDIKNIKKKCLRN